MSSAVALLRARHPPETIPESCERLMRLVKYDEVCVSNLSHDLLCDPTVGRARIRAFAATPWGRLFEKY